MRRSVSILSLITAVFMLLTTSVAPHHHHRDHICFAAAETEPDAGETQGSASDETACPLSIRAALAEKASPLTAGQVLTAIPTAAQPVVPADDAVSAERHYKPFTARVPLALLTRDNPLRAPPVV